MSRHDPSIQKARALFDRAGDRLDPGMAHRLRLAREAALRPRPATHRSWGLPAGAFAAAVLALGLAWWLPGRPGLAPAAPDPLAGEELEALVVAEDAELYAWLADAPVAATQVRQ